MTKGGARTASAEKAVAKGMGISVFFNVLEEINRLNDWVDIDTVMKNLHFGGERNETCRSYFKELWRYGLIERKEKLRIIDCTPKNWKKGGKPKYKISDKGKELIKIPDKHRTFALAWIVVKSDNNKDFEQLHKAFETFKKREVPLDMFKASEVTGVVRDSIKAIMYGWLEPLGFLDRTDQGTFKLDEEYYKHVNSFKNMREAVPKEFYNGIIIDGILRICTIPHLKPFAPEIDTQVKIPFEIWYKGKKGIKITLKCKTYPLFKNRFETLEILETIELKPDEKIQKYIILNFENKGISESFKETELGTFEIECESKKYYGALPTIFLTTKSHLHEMNLAKLLTEIGYKPIIFTKSDRPDMIIFPNKKEENLEKFLENKELKILVETTSSDVLSLQKVKDDLKNFKQHTTKVLKINAKRTLIVGKSLSGTIELNIQKLLKKYHPFTIITMDDLEYLNQKIKEKKDNSWEKIGEILTFDGIADRCLIDSVFD